MGATLNHAGAWPAGALRPPHAGAYMPGMAQTRAWRNFKRMQDTTVAVASLIYAGAVLHAFERLPGNPKLLSELTLVWPAGFLLLSALAPLAVGVFRRGLARYVWMSFEAGFGQSAGSVLVGVGLLGGAALFMYLQIAGAAEGGAWPAAVFSSYGAGIGILVAQAVLVRVLEQRPEVRQRIED